MLRRVRNCRFIIIIIIINKTIFGRGSTQDPAGRAHNALPNPRVDEEEYFLPILLPFRLGIQGRLVLLLNRYPHFLDQSYAPVFIKFWKGVGNETNNLILLKTPLLKASFANDRT